MQIYLKQIELVKSGFPQATEGQMHQAAYYTFQANALVCGSGLMRRISHRSGGSAAGVAAKFATGIVAKAQERANANKALELLDSALTIFDYPFAHFCKANVYNGLGRKQEALVELNYVIANFPDDQIYISARQMKDEIENPPKKGMCFVATAAYGTPMAPEVVLLSDFRDEVLLRSRLGSLFVTIYYRLSPPLAFLIARSRILRAVTRTFFLSPLMLLLKSSPFRCRTTNASFGPNKSKFHFNHLPAHSIEMGWGHCRSCKCAGFRSNKPPNDKCYDCGHHWTQHV